ncbi:hypothetical protein JMA_26180 [Jeotgalibacillus malaysiensis]|uniref:Uncharacterized protein n=1 Tax=Jeotgalibacillus malaysiensis TaxID=1508404 RepID=A0A0B5ANV0_9BACL|nr:hypothetical protein [Jeotgalibacillus malaysiensis]AJD91935.1 hypothetical protein JMA_26180 [Jeotgalibacillus malaysiensis]
MKLILTVLLIIFISGCTKEPDPPEVSKPVNWLPAVMNEYDLAPETELKKLPVL